MNTNIRICMIAAGLASVALTGCETTVVEEPAVTTTTQTTETTRMHRIAPAHSTTTETHVIRAD